MVARFFGAFRDPGCSNDSDTEQTHVFLGGYNSMLDIDIFV